MDMARYVVVLLLALFVIASIDTLEVKAASSKNPYSGYNISGINYGAQQWDRQHGKSSGSANRGRYRRR